MEGEMPFPRHLVKTWGKELGWKCEVCGRKWVEGWLLEGHHIYPTFAGGADIRSNFKLLCIEDHYKAHLKLRERGVDHPASANIVKARWIRTGGRWK